MVSLAKLKAAMADCPTASYQCQGNLNLYDSPQLASLATQAVAGRQLRILSLPQDADGRMIEAALQVCLWEDDYPGWLPLEDIDLIDLVEDTESRYGAIALSAAEIRRRLPRIIAYAHAAMAQPNRYLWGGTVGPNYDCSGLVQTAFAAAGIWLPRDAYQQEGFTEAIAIESAQPGDLIFFGPPAKATHVGIYLGDGSYIHSSGKDMGRNGIGIDRLSADENNISRAYYQQVRGAGRVTACYQPVS